MLSKLAILVIHHVRSSSIQFALTLCKKLNIRARSRPNTDRRTPPIPKCSEVYSNRNTPGISYCNSGLFFRIQLRNTSRLLPWTLLNTLGVCHVLLAHMLEYCRILMTSNNSRLHVWILTRCTSRIACALNTLRFYGVTIAYL